MKPPPAAPSHSTAPPHTHLGDGYKGGGLASRRVTFPFEKCLLAQWIPAKGWKAGISMETVKSPVYFFILAPIPIFKEKKKKKRHNRENKPAWD